MTGNIAKLSMTLGLGAAVAFGQAAGTPTPQAPAASGQSAYSKVAEAHGQGAHSADHGMSTNKGAGLLVGKEDQEFLIKAAQSEMAEIEATRIAQEKASSNEVKEFARKLEQDHKKANDQLKHLAADKNVDLPADGGKYTASLEKLKNLSGDKFDKEFMKMQVKHHKKDVSEFQKQTTRSMDSDVKAFATTTLPTLQAHLTQAEQLKDSTGTRGRSVDTSTPAAPAADSAAKPKSDDD